MENLDISSVESLKALSALLSAQQEEDEDCEVRIYSHDMNTTI